MKPQSKLWIQIPQQAAGYYTLRFAGLFNLPIPLRFAFGIGVSLINLQQVSAFKKIRPHNLTLVMGPNNL